MALNNENVVGLQISHFLQEKVGDSFPRGMGTRVFTREEIYNLLHESVRKSLEIYQTGFALGMRKILAEARLRAAIITNVELDSSLVTKSTDG
jgi:hypothetical protein